MNYMLFDGLVDVLDGLLLGGTVQLPLLVQDHGVTEQGPDAVGHGLPHLGPHIAALQSQHNLNREEGGVRRYVPANID